MRPTKSKSCGIGILLVFVLVSTGCNDFSHLANQVKAAATADQWQAWATQVLERSKTNSSPPPRSEWPSFINRVHAPCTEWELCPTGRSTGSTNISLVSIGGFGCFSVEVGTNAFSAPYAPDEQW